MFQLSPGDFEKARETLDDLEARYPALNDAQRILLEAQLAASSSGRESPSAKTERRSAMNIDARKPGSEEIGFTQSRWLREAKASILLRDPVDAVNDAEALVRFAQARFDQVSGTGI